MKALDESVIIEVFARRKGEEIKVGNIIVGREQQGEVPEWGTIVSVGERTQGLVEGDIVLLPNGRLTHVPDPNVVAGKITKDDPSTRQLITTHWKNVQVKYGN